ncbi:hypothetical protein [uncultured Clostridium sp.]|uniref:hypothetical protein n=1 Tax=uncultured Clostridium sp. TaxID=59620 RepID=UPI003216C3FB
MAKGKSKKQQSSSNKKINISIDEISEGKAKKIVNIGGNYIMADIDEEEVQNISNSIEKATYDMNKLEHVYSKLLDKENSSYVTTLEELTALAKNTQSDINKILKINGIVKYYVNKEDLIGRVVETIENNINTNYKIDFPNTTLIKKKDKKIFNEMKKIIDDFNEQIDVKNLIIENCISTYSEGNYVMYLKGSNEKGYGVINYPLGITEITNMKIDNEPIITFNVGELKSRLQQNLNKYGSMKSKQPIDLVKTLDEEIKRDYPEEVYNAYSSNDKYAFLSPSRVGACRINNLKGCYGVTPIFKSLSPQLMLETLDKVDRKNLIAQAKKIYFQPTRKEMIKDGKLQYVNEIGYAHTSLINSMGNDTVVYTAMPYIEDLKILEPKNKTTEPQTILQYRNRVLNSLGISYLSGESSSSYNTTTVNYSEMLKTVNKISKQLEPIINKFYKTVLQENGFDLELYPKIVIESTEILDFESRCKLVDILYSKIGISYKTVLETMGIDYNTEIERRKEENNYEVENGLKGFDNIFTPHTNSFTSNSNDLLNTNIDDETNSNGSKKNQDEDKREYDQDNQGSKL